MNTIKSVKIINEKDLPYGLLRGFRNPVLARAWDDAKNLEEGKMIIIKFINQKERKKALDSLKHRRIFELVPQVGIYKFGDFEVALTKKISTNKEANKHGN